jgi:hypothetical protein
MPKGNRLIADEAGIGSASEGNRRAAEKTDGGWLYPAIFAGVLAIDYIASLWWSDWLRFPLDRDELHYWPASLVFSHSLVPSLQTLRSYNELSTPLAFFIFGQIQRLTSHGLILCRYFNLGLSAALLVMIGCVRRKPDRRSLLSAVGLLLYPYYLGVATHVYPDIIAACFVVLGVMMHQRQRCVLAALSWTLAISSRQYMVAFPAGVVAYELSAETRSDIERWMWPLLAAASLAGWFLFFGGYLDSLGLFRARVIRLWRRVLIQRSQS